MTDAAFSPWSEALFLVTAIVAIGGAVATIAARRPLRAAMGLLAHIIALAGLYLTLHAQLLAAIQLLVYAGAVVVLFVFVIMLIGPSASESKHRGRGLALRVVTGAVMAMITVAVTSAVVDTTVFVAPLDTREAPSALGTVESLGASLYGDAVIPFELVSITLLVAVLGALAVGRGRSRSEIALAQARRQEREAQDQAQLEREKKLSAEVAAHGGH